MKPKRIIVALDNNNLRKTLELVTNLKKEVFAFKVGYEFFFNHGIEGYKKIKNISSKIFLDLKLHDIPNTVQNGILAINKLRPLLTTVHISGGDGMMQATLVKNKYTKILGVSLLTSFDNKQTNKFYNEKKVELLVKKFARIAKHNNLDGLVCSPQEIKMVRKILGKNFLIVTPGIRPKNYIQDDQKRTMTPKDAITLGANLIVIGRPITKSKNPLGTIKEINNQLN